MNVTLLVALASVAAFSTIASFIYAVYRIQKDDNQKSGFKLSKIGRKFLCALPVACLIAAITFGVLAYRAYPSDTQKKSNKETMVSKLIKEGFDQAIEAIQVALDKKEEHAETDEPDNEADFTAFTDEMLRINEMDIEEVLNDEKYAVFFQDIGIRTTYDEMAWIKEYLIKEYGGFNCGDAVLLPVFLQGHQDWFDQLTGANPIITYEELIGINRANREELQDLIDVKAESALEEFNALSIEEQQEAVMFNFCVAIANNADVGYMTAQLMRKLPQASEEFDANLDIIEDLYAQAYDTTGKVKLGSSGTAVLGRFTMMEHNSKESVENHDMYNIRMDKLYKYRVAIPEIAFMQLCVRPHAAGMQKMLALKGNHWGLFPGGTDDLRLPAEADYDEYRLFFVWDIPGKNGQTVYKIGINYWDMRLAKLSPKIESGRTSEPPGTKQEEQQQQAQGSSSSGSSDESHEEGEPGGEPDDPDNPDDPPGDNTEVSKIPGQQPGINNDSGGNGVGTQPDNSDGTDADTTERLDNETINNESRTDTDTDTGTDEGTDEGDGDGGYVESGDDSTDPIDTTDSQGGTTTSTNEEGKTTVTPVKTDEVKAAENSEPGDF